MKKYYFKTKQISLCKKINQSIQVQTVVSWRAAEHIQKSIKE